MTQIYFKMKDINKALILYKKGIEKARAFNDDVLIAEFNYLKASYIDSIDKRTVFQTFSVLKDNVMYPDLEELKKLVDGATFCDFVNKLKEAYIRPLFLSHDFTAQAIPCMNQSVFAIH
ncbi:hypothetical protein [Bacillus inaquosorum]|nr:hypothetical protein [Bacillus inaquosorum]MCY8176593.1 hypothetical protein [Bacillus inaquosorum]